MPVEPSVVVVRHGGIAGDTWSCESLEATFCDNGCDTGGLSRVVGNGTYRVSHHIFPGRLRLGCVLISWTEAGTTCIVCTVCTETMLKQRNVQRNVSITSLKTYNIMMYT